MDALKPANSQASEIATGILPANVSLKAKGVKL